MKSIPGQYAGDPVRDEETGGFGGLPTMDEIMSLDDQQKSKEVYKCISVISVKCTCVCSLT